MNARQKRFCEEYLVDCNATQAAIRAGYSPKTARYASQWINEKNLQKPTKNFSPEMRDYIDEQLDRLHSERTADAQEILEYLTSVMRGEQTEKTMQAVGDGMQEIVDIAVGARDRLKAAELLGKRYGIFTDKVSLDVQPVVLINDLPDEPPGGQETAS